MNLKFAWIPAIAGLVLFVGCESKSADTIPKTAPMAAKEAFEILPHLKYIAATKDYKDIPVIAPQDLGGLYGNAWWFHKHAGQCEIALTAEEIKGLGVEKAVELGYLAPDVSNMAMSNALDKVSMKELPGVPANMQGLDLMKLDLLPGEKDKVGGKDFAEMNGPLLRPMYNAGIYRLLKGVPMSMWNDVVILTSTVDPKVPLDTQMVLGYQGKPILKMTVRQKADKTYGVIYVQYLMAPKALAKAAAAAAQQK